jgi:DNA-binding NarL/FixJ family response regulator
VLDDASEDSSFGETVPATDFSGYLNSAIESGELTPEEIRSALAGHNNLRRPDWSDVLSELNAKLGDDYCLARFKEFSKNFPRQALALVLKACGAKATEIARSLNLASAGAARVFVHGARKRLLGFFSQDMP